MNLRDNIHNQAMFTCRTHITALPGHPATRNKTARPPRCVLCVLQTLGLRPTVLRPPSTPRAVLRKDVIVGHPWIMAALGAGLEAPWALFVQRRVRPHPGALPADADAHQRSGGAAEPNPPNTPKHTQTHTSAIAGEMGREVTVVTTLIARELN